MTEAELAKEVVIYLKDAGYDVYEEVMPMPQSKIADIIAVRKFKSATEIIAVECKMTYSWEVLEQAYDWLGVVNKSYIAVPDKVNKYASKRSRGRSLDHMKEKVLRSFGIGLIKVSNRARQYNWNKNEPDKFELRVEMRLPARYGKIHPVYRNRMMNALRPEHQNGQRPAGSKDGTLVTPFSITCDKVRTYLQRHPGSDMKSIIENITHHYSNDQSARHSLRIWIAEGKVKGVTAKLEKGKYIYFTEQDTEHETD